MMKTLQLALLVVLPSIFLSVSGTVEPNPLDGTLDAVFVGVTQVEHPEALIIIPGDDSFFTDVIGFNSSQVADLLARAIEFYAIRFGLDFSALITDPETGAITDGNNALLLPWTNDVTFGFSFAANADTLIGGVKVPTYYPIRTGGFTVLFNGPQTLFGTYGGPTGLPVGDQEGLLFGFYYCEDCPNAGNGPLILELRTPTPVRPLNNNVINNFEFTHPVYGDGIGRGFFRADPPPSGSPDLVYYTYRIVITFPGPRRI